MLTEARLSQGLPLEEVADRHWPRIGREVVAADASAVFSAEDRAFLGSLRPRALTAVILCIDG